MKTQNIRRQEGLAICWLMKKRGYTFSEVSSGRFQIELQGFPVCQLEFMSTAWMPVIIASTHSSEAQAIARRQLWQCINNVWNTAV